MKCDFHYNCQNVGKICTIKSIVKENKYPYFVHEIGENFSDNELELYVEEETPFAAIFVNTIGNLIQEKDKKIAELKKELKEANKTKEYLLGKCVAYESLLEINREEVK